MIADRLFGQAYFRLATRISSLWIRPSVLPDEPAHLLGDGQQKVCYVLEYGGLADRLALQQACERNDLPLPSDGLEYAGLNEARAIIRLRSFRGLFLRVPSPELSQRLTRVIEAGSAAVDKELLCIPVAIYWGRSPQKERGFFKLAFSERWDFVGRTRRFLTTFVHGRNTLVQFSKPLPLKAIFDEGLPPPRAVRKVSRILRVHFRHRRTAALGPDLSHRRTLVDRVLLDDQVRRAIRREGKDDPKALEKARRDARTYAFEIAADCSYPTIRVLERILARVWNRLYEGIQLHGIERVHEVAEGNELVYVPCHRSHMDYLLLSYIIYHQGLSIPHIAAGINLNLPIVGPALRRGGAFFMRRRFKGNRLYAEVFRAYMRELQSAGFSLEYFVEGGRSRTGRLLKPKVGMLNMTVDSYVAEATRPLYFVPVYFGYEKMVEGRSFIGELSGEKKQKESLFALLRSLKKLRENFGEVYVNFGRPIELEEFISARAPGWREIRAASDGPEEAAQPDWFAGVVADLGDEIMERINAAAAVTPISLIALAMLSTPRQTMPLADLRGQLEFFLLLLREFPYSAEVALPRMDADAIIAHGEQLGVISREAHALGDLIHMSEQEAVLMTYFRNNILHLFAIPASIACAFMNGHNVSEQELVRLVGLSYPFIRSELYMHWADEECATLSIAAIRALEKAGILIRSEDGLYLEAAVGGSRESAQLQQLGQLLVPVLQRYYMTIALLGRYGSGAVTPAELERVCQLCAQRLSIMYGLRSPDFFDGRLFQLFIRNLRDHGVVRVDGNGRLIFDDTLMGVNIDARLLLGEQIHHSILDVTAVEPDALVKSEG